MEENKGEKTCTKHAETLHFVVKTVRIFEITNRFRYIRKFPRHKAIYIWKIKSLFCSQKGYLVGVTATKGYM